MRANPREILQLGKALDCVLKIKNISSQLTGTEMQVFAEQLNPCTLLKDKIFKELKTDAPALVNKGVVINEGVDAELDEIEMPTPEQVTELLEQLTPETETLAESPTLVTEPELDQLEMRFSQNCWVNVLDAEGNRVAYGTKQAGYIMQVTGTAPFTVTLGNPSVVTINFNQQAFDMSAFPGGRVAKFTIPESE